MPTVLTSSQQTFVDITDQRKLSAYITSNLPKTQSEDPNVLPHTYAPSWATTSLTLTPVVFLDQTSIALGSTGLTISWKRKDGTSAETSLAAGESASNGILTVSQDKLAAIGTIMGSAMTTEDGNPSAYAKLNTLLDAGVTLDQYLDLHEAGAVDGYMRYTSVSAGRNYGITPDVYIDFRARLPRYDADHNGSFTQKEVQAALDSMGGGGLSLPSLDGEAPKTLTNTQKAVLWQCYNKSWKPWNNPFDRTIGQWVYDALWEEPTERTEELRGLSLPSLNE